ncbi:hypothetical protein EJB05_20753, partial [Eragrostis curvula]
MGAYSNEELQPALPRYCHSHPRRREDGPGTFACLCATFAAVVVAACLIAFFWYVNQNLMDPAYTVVITGVSGLDNPVTSSDTKEGGVLVNPVFNLTVGVASKSSLYGACIDPHTIVKVSYSYLGLALAAGSVPSMCVGPLESSDLRAVVASGSNVAVPGYMIDNLAREMRSGEAMFQVKFNTYYDSEGWWNVMTRVVMVGADAAARPALSRALSEPTVETAAVV